MKVIKIMKNLEESEEFFEEKYQQNPEFKKTGMRWNYNII